MVFNYTLKTFLLLPHILTLTTLLFNHKYFPFELKI